MAKRKAKGASKQIKQMQHELGASGTHILRGFLREDYLNVLRWPQSVRVYEKMEKGDAQVSASIKICTYPITAAKWFIPERNLEPTPENAKLIEAAEFIHEALFERINFEEFLPQALEMLTYGYSVFEKVFKVEDNKVWWDKFAWRKQDSVYKWEQSNGEPGIVQDLSEMGRGHVDIPENKLIYFTFQKRGDNPAGISILRSAYKHWYMKDNFYKIDAIATERNGIGVLVIGLPDGNTKDDQDKAAELGENFYANEQQYIVKPNPNWEVELLSGASTLRDPKNSIDHHNRMITKNVLAQFLDLASGEGGSKALSEDQSGLFFVSLEAIAKIVVSVMNDVILELCKLNGFDLERQPTLNFSHIGNTDFERLSGAISTMVGAGALTVDRELEAHVRNVMQLPEQAEEEEEEELEDDEIEDIDEGVEPEGDENLDDEEGDGEEDAQLDELDSLLDELEASEEDFETHSDTKALQPTI